jgi:hypothetical protein
MAQRRTGASAARWAMMIGLVVILGSLLVVTILPAALFALSYVMADLTTEKCTDAERAAFEEVDHYIAVETRRPVEGSGCDGAFSTTDPAEAVIAHYEGELRRLGWLIEEKLVDPGPWPAMPTEDDPPIGEHAGGGGYLGAHRDIFSISVEYAPGWVGSEDGDLLPQGFVHIWLGEAESWAP